MTLDLAEAAKRVLASEGDHDSSMAERASQACQRMTVHLSRLVGLAGIRTLFHRSLILASASFPWLVDATARRDPDADPFEALRAQMQANDPDAVVAAFTLVLTLFVGSLARLIGEQLVWRLLHEVWPTVFPYDLKERT